MTLRSKSVTKASILTRQTFYPRLFHFSYTDFLGKGIAVWVGNPDSAMKDLNRLLSPVNVSIECKGYVSICKALWYQGE